MALAQVIQPFTVEGTCVRIIGSRACEHLCVARPTEAFVALRAVGGHAQEIVALAPDDVAVKLVYVRMASFKSSQFFEVGTDEFSRKFTDFHIRGGCYFAVTEAEESGGGLECLALFRSFQRVVECGFRRAEIVGVEASARSVIGAVGCSRVVQHFPELEAELRAAFSFGREPYPSRHVLSEVEKGGFTGFQPEGFRAFQCTDHIDSAVSGAGGFRAFIYGDGLGRAAQEVAHLDRGAAEGCDFSVEFCVFSCGEPFGGIIFRHAPVAFAACVIRLAVVDVS